jgi:hypothetical protein
MPLSKPMTTLADPSSYALWHVPLSRHGMTLRAAAEALAQVGAQPDDIPLMVRLAENPKFNLFHGAVDLKTHDYIHAVLGAACSPRTRPSSSASPWGARSG